MHLMLLGLLIIVIGIALTNGDSLRDGGTRRKLLTALALHPPCIPGPGRTALIIGQDYHSINNYTAAFSSNSNPFGLMSYTALHSPNGGDLAGMSDPIDYGSGIEWVQGLVTKYPSSAIQLGLWLVGQLDGVLVGQYDDSIHRLAAFMNQTSNAFYLRIGYEFDTLESNYDVSAYKSAFQYIVSKIRGCQVRNVQFVWHASGFKPRNELAFADWFPGEEYVDWCGISLFQQPYDSMDLPNQFAVFCTQRRLPLMIAESTPFGGIVDDSMLRADPLAENEAGYKGSTWTHWFYPVFDFIHAHDVRIWCYINANWDALPMWTTRHEMDQKGVAWGDSRLEASKDIANRWKKDVLQTARTVLSYEYESRGKALCENIPLNNSASASDDALIDVINGLFSGNKTAYKKHQTWEQEFELGLKDLLIVFLKFFEVVMFLGFSIICFMLVTACCYKVFIKHFDHDGGYTTIQ